MSPTTTVEGILEVVRRAAREGRLTKVGHWRNMRIYLDGEQADTLVEFATCTLYMRGELYGHETPVTQRGEAADERYLIEAIEENTTDPATRELIAYWFAQYDE